MSLPGDEFDKLGMGIPHWKTFCCLRTSELLIVRLLDILHHPDVSALWPEAIKKQPMAVRRPHRIIDSHVGIIEFENFFRFARINRRDPNRCVPNHVHSARMIRRKRHVRSARDFTKHPGLSARPRDYECLRITVTRRPKNDFVTTLAPAKEMAHHAHSG